MHFIKYHGLGNDFLLFEKGLEGAPSFAAEEVRQLCGRGTGIGADGLIFVRHSEVADYRMELVNQDGSIPEMCGNGIRCFIKHIVEDLGERRNPLRVETPAGVRICHWTFGSEEEVVEVKVEMGGPQFERAQIPMDGHGPTERIQIQSNAHGFEVTGVGMGNPHMVIFEKSTSEWACQWGPSLSSHPMWPQGANVEWVEVISPTHLKVTVWERGCGLTQACGTGATAAVAAAVKQGLCPSDENVSVQLPGGVLKISIAADFSQSWMTGPAERVFRGQT